MSYESCTPEEQQQRIHICKFCPKFWISEDNKTYCLEANKSISYMLNEKQISCPVGKW